MDGQVNYDMGDEITRKSVLLECLQLMREKLKAVSKSGRMLEPADKATELMFERKKKKCQILQDLIQAYDSEPVRKALANWQQEIMKADAAGKPHAMKL